MLKNSFLKYAIFWDVKPSCPVAVPRRFGGIYKLPLQQSSHSWLFLPGWWLTHWHWRQRVDVPPKRCWIQTALQGVTSQKTTSFAVSAVRTHHVPALLLQQKCQDVNLFERLRGTQGHSGLSGEGQIRCLCREWNSGSTLLQLVFIYYIYICISKAIPVTGRGGL
jgi:hypothetical protein